MAEYMVFGNTKPTEYFCYACKQLRLSYNDDKSKCHNCNSTQIVTGKVGELDKEKLKNDPRTERG